MRSRFFRPSACALALLALASASPTLSAAPEAAVEIVRVWPEYRASDSFVRLGEYFGGKEKTAELLARSQPESRDGYYFLARFKTPAARPGAMIALEYILPGEELARLHFFPVDLPRGSRAVLAGLTGSDWPGVAVEPTAWRLRLLAADGTELARQQSFLWSLPPTEASASAPSAPATTPAG